MRANRFSAQARIVAPDNGNEPATGPRGGLTVEDAKSFVATLGAEKRYVRDVY